MYSRTASTRRLLPGPSCSLIGPAGSVAYGFEAIHASYGDVELVDRSGAANLVKPLGLFFPLSFVLVAGRADQARPPPETPCG